MATPDLDRLAARVKAHRLELYPSRLAAARAAGISKDTWQRVEEGESVREATYAKIDKALGWVVGTCVAVMNGREPVLAGADAGGDGSPMGGALSGSAPSAEQLRRAAFEAARAKLPNAPIGAIDEFSEELVEILRRAGSVADGS
ncbi:helix-turn-helix domain-containing protein [Streptomyces sp. NPDC056160]|uniref:helix-turn-helix domain-containing protein n=1 Tax=Streptomyces sp. NPDC056160 TaxID=3345731 RepID=UPI0035DD2A69